MMAIGAMRDALEVERENSWRGGRERLRWAQCSPERGVGSPEAWNTLTHTHTHSLTHADTFQCAS